MKPLRTVRNGAGFTLIEVLVGVGIFLTTMVGLSSLLTTTMRTNNYARNVTAATNLAGDKMEELGATAYAALAGGSDPDPLTEAGTAGGAGAIYTRSWTVADGPEADTKLVTVTVTWLDRSLQQVELQSIVAE
ncbi:MAG: type IV pilus modification PilV family protein [Candidatus Binatia bacterium]